MTLLEALDAIVPTPAGHQVWISEATALDTLRCPPDELARLVDAGLATRDGRYENFDVWNLALLGGDGRTRPEREMTFFARLLRSFGGDWVTSRVYEITGRAECPLGAACPAPVWGTPRLPVIEWRDHDTEPGRARWQGRIELRGETATVYDPRVREPWDDVLAGYRFQFTPATLSADVAATVERGVGDCDALSRVLLAHLHDAGIPATLEPAYIFGGSRLRRHSWLRITDSDGRRKTLDVGMALLADRFFTPEYRAFCYGSRLNRVIPLTGHDDIYAEHPCATAAEPIFYDFVLHQATPRPVPAAGERAVS